MTLPAKGADGRPSPQAECDARSRGAPEVGGQPGVTVEEAVAPVEQG